MAKISVAEAAARLGVGVSRVHQRIAAGSLRAERLGAQWVVDEASLVAASESRAAGRPLSARSAWALVAVSRADEPALRALAAAERSRARDRLARLLDVAAPGGRQSEEQVRAVVVLLRSWLRNRAERRVLRSSPRDLPDLRGDARVVLSGLSHPRSGIASGDVVEGYVNVAGAESVVQDYLLSPVAADRDANVVLHAVHQDGPDELHDVPALLLAADLAEHRGPREEARAAELLRELAGRHARADGDDVRARVAPA